MIRYILYFIFCILYITYCILYIIYYILRICSQSVSRSVDVPLLSGLSECLRLRVVDLVQAPGCSVRGRAAWDGACATTLIRPAFGKE